MTFDTQTLLIIGGAVLALLILLLIVLRAARRQSLRRDEPPVIERTQDPYAVSKERPYMSSVEPASAPPAPEAPARPAPIIAPRPDPEEDVVQPAVPMAADFGGIAFPPHATDHVDELTRMKGVGPKLAAMLNEQGITQYAQLASLDDESLAAIDAKMGTFKGRLIRDRVVEQARLLASGDTEAYEAQFGKLGGS